MSLLLCLFDLRPIVPSDSISLGHSSKMLRSDDSSLSVGNRYKAPFKIIVDIDIAVSKFVAISIGDMTFTESD